MSSMNTAASSIKAWISGSKSGNITSYGAALALGVLDMAEMQAGFAKRLLDAFLTKKHLQALAR